MRSPSSDRAAGSPTPLVAATTNGALGGARLVLLVASLTLAAFLAVLNAQVLTPIIPRMSVELAVPEAAIGQLVTAASVAGLALGLIAGSLSDRHGRRPVLVAAAIVLALTSLGAATCRTYLPLLALRFLGGVGAVLLLPAALAALGDFVPPRLQSRAMGCVMAGTGLSLVVGWPVAALTAARWGWRGVFVLMAALFLILIALIVPSVPGARITRPAEATAAPEYRQLLADRQVRLSLGAVGLAAAGWFGFTTYLGGLLAERRAVTLDHQSLVLAGVGALYALGSITSGMLAPRIGERTTAAVGCLAGALALAGLAVPSSPVVALSLTALVAASRGAGVAALNSFVIALRPAERGRVGGLNAVGFSLGVFIGASAGGLALTLTGHAGLELLLAFLSAGASALLLLLPAGAPRPTFAASARAVRPVR